MSNYIKQEDSNEGISELDSIKEEITIEESPDLEDVIKQEFHEDDKPHKCNQCFITFKTLHNLITHDISKHGKKGKFACEVCGRKYINAIELRKHRDIHCNQRNPKCDPYDKAFKTSKNAHGADRSFQCKLCSKTFASAKYLNGHSKVAHGNKIHKCDECSLAFGTLQNLTRHEVSKHGKRGKFYCQVCSKNFITTFDLKQHLVKHSDGKHIKCHQCSLVFGSLQNLTKHEIRKHGKKGKFACEVCGRNFLNTSELERHLVIHSDEKNFKCDQCDKTFKSKWNLRGHKNYVHATERSFQCKECSKSFVNVLNLTRHQLNKHGKEGKFSCEVCGKSFIAIFDLKRHLVAHSDERNFKCDQCDKAFKTNKHLRSHIINVHATEELFQCKVCSKTFASESYLKAHSKGVHGDKLHKCDQCSKAFETLRNLAQHEVNKHGKKGKFACEVCGRNFVSTSYLKKHLIVHNNVVTHAHNKKPHKCDQCSAAFGSLQNLNKHGVNKHGKEAKFACEACGRNFLSTGELERHLVIHSDEKNFKCDQCDKAFKRNMYLSIHKKNVHGTDRPFQCKLCSKSFPSGSYLFKHSKIVHGDKPHKCDQCPLAFGTLHNLTRHAINFHGREGKFACEKCGKNFVHAFELKRHLVKHSDKGKCKCDKCDQSFKQKHLLVVHKKNAHATFKCEKCPRRFSLAGYLKLHSMVHRRGSLFKCDLCPEMFKYKFSLDKHVKKAHKEEDTFEDMQLEGVTTFDDVKVEPVTVYDPDVNRLVLEIKGEISDEIDMIVKQEPVDIDEG